MKQFHKHALAAAFAAIVTVPTHAAPVVTTMDAGSLTASNLVTTLLSGTSDVTVVAGSESYTGSLSASGKFTNGGNNIANSVGIQNGVILTSGDATFVSLPNDNGGYTGNNNSPGSALLNSLGQGLTNNASVLSFRFIPNGNFVQFSYVFGSEEYNNFVNTQFNDVFGFFVNGTNYALLPGTTTPVAINNVNCGGPTGGAANHVNEANCQYFRDNPPLSGLIDVQLDGLTKILSFVAPVNSGVENLMELGIADVSDSNLDSAVFIRGASFSTCGGPNQPRCGTDVPEPGSLVLFAIGIAGLARMRRRCGESR